MNYPKEILPFSRIAVENHLFGELEQALYSIYRLKNITTEQLYQEKRQAILTTYTIKDILLEVCLHKKFWDVEQEALEKILPKA